VAGVSAAIRVLLIDDDPLVRAGLRMILSSAEDLAMVGEAGDGAQTVRAVREHRPDVVLMDIRMPEMDGISATQRLRELPEPPQVIVLTFHLDEYVLRALRAGASGFPLKDTPPQPGGCSGRAARSARPPCEPAWSPASTPAVQPRPPPSGRPAWRRPRRGELRGLHDRRPRRRAHRWRQLRRGPDAHRTGEPRRTPAQARSRRDTDRPLSQAGSWHLRYTMP
jgi:CheY-like chemotaxis protein